MNKNKKKCYINKKSS